MKAAFFPFLLCLVGGGTVAMPVLSNESPGRQVIEIAAKRYGFTPERVHLKSGRPAVLHIRALDVMHGFYIPSLNIRSDLVPGTVVSIELPPLAKGEYPFACDLFCGSGHTGMQGTLVVE